MGPIAKAVCQSTHECDSGDHWELYLKGKVMLAMSKNPSAFITSDWKDGTTMRAMRSDTPRMRKYRIEMEAKRG